MTTRNFELLKVIALLEAAEQQIIELSTDDKNYVAAVLHHDLKTP